MQAPSAVLYTVGTPPAPAPLDIDIDPSSMPELIIDAQPQIEGTGRTSSGAFGDEAKTGKPVGDDLREAKPTVLLARARSLASDEQLMVLDRVGPDITADEVAGIQQVMLDTGAVDACEDEIDELLDQATAALDMIPDVNGSRDALMALADFVVSRDA